MQNSSVNARILFFSINERKKKKKKKGTRSSHYFWERRHVKLKDESVIYICRNKENKRQEYDGFFFNNHFTSCKAIVPRGCKRLLGMKENEKKMKRREEKAQ